MDKTQKLLIFLPVAIIALLLQACAQQETTMPAEIQATSPTEAAYPVSPAGTNLEILPAYPGSEEEVVPAPLISATVLPEDTVPPSGLAIVRGTVIDSATGQAPYEAALYLAKIVTTSEGLRVVRLNRDEDPVIVPVADGRFAFGSVPPGEYGLILFHPDISFVIDDPEDGLSMIFTVEADQVLDLGEFSVTLP